MPKGDRGDRERAPGSSDARGVVGGFRAHVLHGLGRIPRLQSGDLPRTLAERTLLPRGTPDLLVPVCETPLAEADIEYEDRAASLVWMKFPILSGGGDLTIATTRPELLAACRAVMVHPDDARYRSLPGKKVRVPLYGQEVPIIAHPNAKPEFGSGAAMICSYSDMVDIAMFRDLRLEPVKAIDESGRMTEAAGFLKGLKVDAAREKAID